MLRSKRAREGLQAVRAELVYYAIRMNTSGIIVQNVMINVATRAFA